VNMTFSRLNKQRCEIAEPSLGGQKTNSYKGCALEGKTTFTALDVQKRPQISRKCIYVYIYIYIRSVPRSKHTPSQLYKPVS